MHRRVFFVGSQAEVAHHAAPLFDVDSFSTQIVEPAKVVATAEPGDIAIFFSEHFDRFRQAVVDLRNKRVATIYLVDGILEWRNAWENSEDEPACPFTMRPVLCDKVACIGPSQSRVLAGWGNSTKIEVVGIPRLGQLQANYRVNLPRQKTGKTEPFRVLVTTAKTPGFTPEQIATSIRSLSELKHYLENKREISGRPVVVQWRLTAGLEKEIGVQNHLSDLCGGELHESIEQCDAFITTPSTAMLEAMLHHKPTALLNYHHCPIYVPAAWTIHSIESMTPVLNQLANPTPAQIHFQNSILSDALQMAESGTTRLVQLIHSMFAACDQQLQSGKSLEFASNLLPDPICVSTFSGSHCKMDYSSIYGWSGSESNRDTTELQAQLAHARREVEHQKRIGEGLKAELAEAHSIFEQIHQHPIAGPIVRIRERFIQFMNRNKKEN